MARARTPLRQRKTLKLPIVLMIIAGLLVSFLVLYPLIYLIYGSLRTALPGDPGTFTVKNERMADRDTRPNSCSAISGIRLRSRPNIAPTNPFTMTSSANCRQFVPRSSCRLALPTPATRCSSS